MVFFFFLLSIFQWSKNVFKFSVTDTKSNIWQHLLFVPSPIHLHTSGAHLCPHTCSPSLTHLSAPPQTCVTPSRPHTLPSLHPATQSACPRGTHGKHHRYTYLVCTRGDPDTPKTPPRSLLCLARNYLKDCLRLLEIPPHTAARFKQTTTWKIILHSYLKISSNIYYDSLISFNTVLHILKSVSQSWAYSDLRTPSSLGWRRWARYLGEGMGSPSLARVTCGSDTDGWRYRQLLPLWLRGPGKGWDYLLVWRDPWPHR